MWGNVGRCPLLRSQLHELRVRGPPPAAAPAELARQVVPGAKGEDGHLENKPPSKKKTCRVVPGAKGEDGHLENKPPWKKKACRVVPGAKGEDGHLETKPP